MLQYAFYGLLGVPIAKEPKGVCNFFVSLQPIFLLLLGFLFLFLDVDGLCILS
jgi:hypothetical protein